MKKLIIRFVLGLAMASSSAFGQGWFVFGASPRTVWDNEITPTYGTGYDVAFLWAPSTVTAAAVESLSAGGGVATNTTLQYLYSTAWTDILSDPNFTLAQSNNVDYVASTTSTGGYSYNAGSEFDVVGTASLTTYSLFVIAWNTEGGVFTTPQAAAAGNLPVGWSGVFSYMAQAAPPLGAAPSAMPLTKFGIAGMPEPTTLAL